MFSVTQKTRGLILAISDSAWRMLWQCVCIMTLLLLVRRLLPALYPPLSCLDSACGFHRCHHCCLTLLPGSCFCCSGSNIICDGSSLFFFFPLMFSISIEQLETRHADTHTLSAVLGGRGGEGVMQDKMCHPSSGVRRLLYCCGCT